MSLVRLDEISIEFGDNPLLTDASLSIEEDERICLVGRNGAGKTTLLKIISGEIQPDRGDMHLRQHLRVSQLEQTLPAAQERKVFDIVLDGLHQQRLWIEQFEQLSSQGSHDKNQLQEMEALQQTIDASGGWNIEQQAAKVISELELPAEKLLSELSGGWRRRVALGKALVSRPELLLLDEPTNHLDISTIEWLEHEVRGYRGSVLFITHDRDFLQKLATRIVEIDRGKIKSWPGDYKNFLRRKEQAIQEEDTQNALFDKKLAEEEAWIREGIKARRTRNEGRVRALDAMREQRAARIKRAGKAKINIEAAESSGRKVIEARSLVHAYNNETLINNFKIKIMRGDRIGIIGNNGVGKSTLLKILLGHIEPDQGSVKLGTNLEIGYFDQVLRELEEDKSIAHNVGQGKDYIKVNGKERHIIGYLQNFLFAPKRSMTPVKALSGGERNRVSLAKLFTRPTNLLILDEPTNDLDIEMLEVLEERLVQYEGTLIIVSHDREFLDNVVTSILVFEADGGIREYIGGYSDWVKRGLALKDNDTPGKNAVAKTTPATVAKTASRTLTYGERLELEKLPEVIEQLEADIAALEALLSDPEFYAQPYEESRSQTEKLAALHAQLDSTTARWMELEELV